MAVFNPITITDNGKEMLTQALAGQGTLTFVSVSTSTSTPSNPEDLTTLTGIKQTVTPASAILDGNVIQVSALFSNSNLTQGYTANSLGLYAKLGDGAQTLFAVVTATEPDVFPAQNTQSPSSFLYQFNISISDTSQLTVTVPEDGSLPASVFNQMFPGIAAPGQNNDGDALVYNASSGAWGYVNTETVFTTVSGSGEFVSLQKTLADDFKQMQLFGKSVQAETTGVQLFDINTAKNYDEAEITDYSSGTMEIEQSNSAITQSPKLKEWCPTMQVGQSYLLTCETTSTKKYITIGSSQWNFGGIFIPTADDLEENVEWHCTTQRSTAGVIVYYRDTFAGIMIVEGSTEKPYEVYTGGEATTEPTPEFPLPITSAGNYDAEEGKYEIGILVANKNFASNVNVYSGYYTDLSAKPSPEDSRFIRVSKIKIIPGVTYKLSSNLIFYSIWSYDVNDNPIRRRSYSSSNTISLNATDEEIYIGISLQNTSGQADTTAFKFIQVEAGEEQTSYIDGKSQNTSLQIPNPLRGIPVDSGGNYTDAEGQQWVCDYIDRERGKYVQCVQEVVFDGSEIGWRYMSISGRVNQPYLPIKDLKIDTNNKNLLCDRFKPILNSDRENNYNTVYNGFDNNKNDVICFNVENIENLDEWKTFISQNNVRVLYQLKNPIETDLTQDQIAALNLSTYQGITNIGTDTMPQVGMAIESRGFNLAGDLAQNVIDLQSTAKSQAESIQALQNTTQTQGGDIQRLEERTGLLEENLQTLDHIIGVPSTSSPVMIPVVTDDGKFTYTPLVDLVYKIGDIKQTTTNVNPGTYLGGTWIPWGTGRTPVGVDADQAEFNTVEKTGGEITHTLDEGEIPEHNHAISADELQGLGLVWVNSNEMEVSSTQGQPHEYMWSEPENTQITCNTNATGGGQPHNNLQPYITCYYWKRTA